MIRRFYIMPLRPGIRQSEIDELIYGMNACDRFLEGISDSSAGLDFDSRTVIWENNLVNEEMYSGPYMHHPYHAATLDDYLMQDSPQCYTHDIHTTRYHMEEGHPRLEKGIRRLALLKLPEGHDTAKLEALAASAANAATSVVRPDDVGWVSAKGRAWTHIWEMGFTDGDARDRHLRSRDGLACSSIEGFKRLGVPVDAMKIFTYPFDLTGAQGAQPLADETAPAFYSITARLDLADVDTFAGLLRECYDPYVSDGGGKLLHRFRTVDGGYPWAEVQSIWEIPSVAAYHDLRIRTGSDPRWVRFVTDAMPLVKGGTRRFSRTL